MYLCSTCNLWVRQGSIPAEDTYCVAGGQSEESESLNNNSINGTSHYHRSQWHRSCFIMTSGCQFGNIPRGKYGRHPDRSNSQHFSTARLSTRILCKAPNLTSNTSRFPAERSIRHAQTCISWWSEKWDQEGRAEQEFSSKPAALTEVDPQFEI